MIALSQKLAEKLHAQPETGMGYQVITVFLKDGRRFDQVAVVEGFITEIRGRKDVPFAESDIADIIVTHDKWNFSVE
jgi:hypothetical protein